MTQRIAQRADRILEIRNGSIIASSGRVESDAARRRITAGPVVADQDRAAELPITAPAAPAVEASAGLGAGFGLVVALGFGLGGSGGCWWPWRSIRELLSSSVIACTERRQARAGA